MESERLKALLIDGSLAFISASARRSTEFLGVLRGMGSAAVVGKGAVESTLRAIARDMPGTERGKRVERQGAHRRGNVEDAG